MPLTINDMIALLVRMKSESPKGGNTEVCVLLPHEGYKGVTDVMADRDNNGVPVVLLIVGGELR